MLPKSKTAKGRRGSTKDKKTNAIPIQSTTAVVANAKRAKPNQRAGTIDALNAHFMQLLRMPSPEISSSSSVAITDSSTASKSSPSDASSTPDSIYFGTYARLRIHESMLKDRIRTLTYRDAIMHNKHLFKDKVVLDVGCGTGILSLFAARAGARLVLAVDCADIAQLAAQVVEKNHLAHKIKVFQAKIEEVVLPVTHVDIIISEWMGYCLLFESMLDSVLFARDKWLRPGGLLMPDHCALFMSGVACRDQHSNAIEYWSNVAGEFDMSAMRGQSLAEGRVMQVNAPEVATEVFQLKRFNLHTVRREELTLAVPFRLKMSRDDMLYGFSTHFTVEFRCCHRPIMLTTSPLEPPTHWKQTVFFFREAITAKAGEHVYGIFRLAQNSLFHRTMDITLDVAYRGDYEAIQWNKLKYCVQ